MNGPDPEAVEIFLQEASEHLQYLREYSGMLQEPQTTHEDLEKLYIAAHTLAGTSATYGFPQFSEVAAKMAHIFHYATNAALTPDMYGPLTEFISDAISVLEFDLLQISSNGMETVGEVATFKQRYAFAFPAAPNAADDASAVASQSGSDPFSIEPPEISFAGHLPPDGEVPDDVLEFFVPEAEEHLQSVTECLLSLEGNPNADDINRLFRSMHTVKGSAAQVGLHRLSAVAHRVEDLIGRLRDGLLQPSAEIVDLLLQSVDVLKNFLHRQWPSDEGMAASVGPLLARIAELAPEEIDDEAPQHPVETEAVSTTGAVESATAAPPRAARPGSQGLAQAKSVRISLDRLDRMMNAVGELVINRTRMLGRLSELSKLVEVLTFSKARLSTKISEFQEKHEFSRIRPTLVPGSRPPQMDTFRGHLVPGPPVMSSDLLEFSELEMDRYDDFNILSRSLTEISADITEVLTQLDGFVGRVDMDIDEFTKLAHHLQDEITRRAWCRSAISTRVFRAPCATQPRPPASRLSSRSKAPKPNSTTTSFSRSPIR